MTESPDHSPKPSPWDRAAHHLRERNNRRANALCGVVGLGAAAVSPFIFAPESTEELILISGLVFANALGGSYLLCDALYSKVLEDKSKKRKE